MHHFRLDFQHSIFFGDLNYAADSALYAEMVQNRSFEYSAADNLDWNFFTSWELLGARDTASVHAATDSPLHPNNPHYLALRVEEGAGRAGIRNRGYGGMVITKGASYDFSCFVRTVAGTFDSIRVEVRSRLGELLASAALGAASREWGKLTMELDGAESDPFAFLALIVEGAGVLAVDIVSLLPRATFRNRPNGLRADLAQTIADLKPRFMRFPGGCLVHGDGLSNMYRWKETIGSVEQRRSQPNLWGYHQSIGLGYYEYFQFCEDIGAKPLPVVPAGCCCPNTDARWTGAWEEGQQGLPQAEMGEYIQEVLGLIEWANGPVESHWGGVRAAAGHPEPFGLEYIGIGNEDRITEVFKDRFAQIYATMRTAHPEITVIGTVGPRPEGEDYDLGWEFARGLDLEMVDEHEYCSPDWHWENLVRYDAYDRNGPQVYLGEYAAHDLGRRNTWRAALAEAAWMTALERNADVVTMFSYAPLLGKRDRLQWRPDLIYFDNRTVAPSLNYLVQRAFSNNAGDQLYALTLGNDKDEKGNTEIAASCMRDSGDLIIKMVSRLDSDAIANLNLEELAQFDTKCWVTTLSAYLDAEGTLGSPTFAEQKQYKISSTELISLHLLAHSLTIVRVCRPQVNE